MRALPIVLLFAGGLALADDDPPVFRSDVALVRVDVRVTGSGQKSIQHLTARDFVLRDNGKAQAIQSFASEEMPLDVLFLIDVSGSMQSHVERLAAASRDALSTLATDDRVAVMVFDRATRLRLPLTNHLESVERDLRSIIRSEGFNGGTDITRALLDGARYVGRSARKESRRAIVILTDDQTEMDRDEFRVGQALRDADTVLSALIAPDAIGSGQPGSGRYPSGRYPSGGGWGDIILGPRRGGGYPGPGGGGGYPMPGGRSRTRSAGTPEIARASGGDSLPVDHATALQDTLDSLRQRYSLYFSIPPGAQGGQTHRLAVDLAPQTRQRFPGAELSYREDYRVPEGGGTAPPESAETVTVSQASEASEPAAATRGTAATPPVLKRRPMGETYGSRGPNPSVGAGAPAAAAQPAPAAQPVPASSESAGWRKATAEDAEQVEASKRPVAPKKN